MELFVAPPNAIGSYQQLGLAVYHSLGQRIRRKAAKLRNIKTHFGLSVITTFTPDLDHTAKYTALLVIELHDSQETNILNTCALNLHHFMVAKINFYDKSTQLWFERVNGYSPRWSELRRFWNTPASWRPTRAPWACKWPRDLPWPPPGLWARWRTCTPAPVAFCTWSWCSPRGHCPPWNYINLDLLTIKMETYIYGVCKTRIESKLLIGFGLSNLGLNQLSANFIIMINLIRFYDAAAGSFASMWKSCQ